MPKVAPTQLPPLPAAFYEPPVLRVARRLLGCLLIRRIDGELLVGRIVETEAYGRLLDPASHSHRGLTPRCRTMFGPRGRAYVYFTYGNHYCMNVTAGRREEATAVLLRAVEPIAGLEAMRGRRQRRDAELCNGPGKLTAAFAIDRALDGTALTRRGELWLARGSPVARAHWTPRIGLGANPARGWLWRCVATSTPGASPVPRAWPRAARPTPALGALRRGDGLPRPSA